MGRSSCTARTAGMVDLLSISFRMLVIVRLLRDNIAAVHFRETSKKSPKKIRQKVGFWAKKHVEGPPGFSQYVARL